MRLIFSSLPAPFDWAPVLEEPVELAAPLVPPVVDVAVGVSGDMDETAELDTADVDTECTTVRDVRSERSFWRRKLRRRQRSDALARCHARRGRMLIGGYASNASSVLIMYNIYIIVI